MIAKDYTTDDKIYCYKGSNVLKNKLNLKSYEQKSRKIYNGNKTTPIVTGKQIGRAHV